MTATGASTVPEVTMPHCPLSIWHSTPGKSLTTLPTTADGSKRHNVTTPQYSGLGYCVKLQSPHRASGCQASTSQNMPLSTQSDPAAVPCYVLTDGIGQYCRATSLAGMVLYLAAHIVYRLTGKSFEGVPQGGMNCFYL